MLAPPPACHSTVTPCFYGRPGFLHKHSQLWISFFPSPQAVSSQPMAVLSLGLLSNPHIPAPSPRAHWQTCFSLGCAGLWHRLCRSHSVLSATDGSFHPPPTASDALLLSQIISPSVRGLPWMREPLPFLSSPPGSQVLSHFLSSSFSFLLSFIIPS